MEIRRCRGWWCDPLEPSTSPCLATWIDLLLSALLSFSLRCSSAIVRDSKTSNPQKILSGYLQSDVDYPLFLLMSRSAALCVCPIGGVGFTLNASDLVTTCLQIASSRCYFLPSTPLSELKRHLPHRFIPTYILCMCSRILLVLYVCPSVSCRYVEYILILVPHLLTKTSKNHSRIFYHWHKSSLTVTHNSHIYFFKRIQLLPKLSQLWL